MELKDYMALHYRVVIEEIEDEGENFLKAFIKNYPGQLYMEIVSMKCFLILKTLKRPGLKQTSSLKRNINLPKRNDLEYKWKMT